MNTFQILTLVVAAIGAVIVTVGTLIGIGRGFESLKTFITEKINGETTARQAAMKELEDKLFKQISDTRASQDNIFREIVTALRSYIEKVEQEMHKIEIWGRDHYAQKPDVDRAIGAVRSDVKEFRGEVQMILGQISSKISEVQIDVAKIQKPDN